jgi:hypothetical protein
VPRRLFVCPVIGTGTKADPYRASVADYGVPYVTLMANDPTTGAPLHNRTLALVNVPVVTDLDPILADPTIRAVPARLLDDPLSSLTTAQRNALRDAAIDLGVDTSVYSGDTLLRRVIRDMGRSILSSFNEDPAAFDVADS